MTKWFFLALAVAVMILGGCASSSTASSDDQANPRDANGNPVSTQPWNAQQSWESGGQLGAAMGH